MLDKRCFLLISKFAFYHQFLKFHVFDAIQRFHLINLLNNHLFRVNCSAYPYKVYSE